MINVETIVQNRHPNLSIQRPVFFKSLILFLRYLFREEEFQKFASTYPNFVGSDFVDQVLDYFRFTYTLPANERQRIPEVGRVIIVANHPIGSLDGLALLQMVREIHQLASA